ncbi:MAG: hypothetical protein HYY06_06190 [Deltaproteobacteria bacterium]|nr:hypothetical protein [Deltaproteobacteria bacterium]
MRGRTPQAFAVLAALLGGCQCGFDSGKLDRIACKTDPECSPDQSCLDDLCVQRGCVDEADCGAGWDFACDAGFCVADACGADDPCAGGFDCDEQGWCRARDVPACEGASDCTPAEDCDGDVCVPRPCEDATDCGDGWAFACEEGVCQADACGEGDPCEEGFECAEAGWCRAEGGQPCEGASDCTPAEGCAGDVCVPRPCEDATDCGDGWVFACEEGVCEVEACGEGDPCDEGVECADEGWCREAEPECERDDDCVDGLYCNGRETCEDGECMDGPAPDCSVIEVGPCEVASCDEGANRCLVAGDDCDDGLDCTTDSCDDELTCTNEIDPGFCLIDSVCVPAGDDPEDQCSLCDPELDPEGWTDWTGSCDDDRPCTWQDSCQTGICAGDLYSCDDFHDCTVDTCDGAGGCSNVTFDWACFIDDGCWGHGDPAPDDPCLVCDFETDQFAWTLDADATCDDDDPCTEDDGCGSGSCAGAPYECDDGLDCTGEECDGAGGCDASIDPGTCAIEGACRADGEMNPLNPCQECDPESDQDGWTNDDSNTPSDGILCTVDGCAAGAQVHTPNDGMCPIMGQTCSLCAGGCVTFTPVSVSCPDEPTAPGAPGATCTIAAGVSGLEACLECGTAIGITSLISDTFDGCPDPATLGWTVAGPAPGCPALEKLGPDPTIREDQLTFKAPEGGGRALTTAKQRVSTSGFDSVRLCFDYADLGAALDDWIRVLLDTGLGYQIEWADPVGPIGSSDLTWVTTCLDLVELAPAAADNDNLGVMFEVDVGGGNSTIFLDNVMLDAWDSDFIGRPGPVSIAGFAGCDLGGWVPGVVEPVCPISGGANDGVEALEADDAAWRISQTFDVSDRCDDIAVGFSYGTRNVTPPMNEDDFGSLSYDFGLGETVVWGALGRTGPNDAFNSFVVFLSHLDPEVRFQPALELTFDLVATDPDNNLYLDDLVVDGVTCESGDNHFTIDGPADVGGGQYSISISSPTQATAYLSCEWAGIAGTAGRDQLVFEE